MIGPVRAKESKKVRERGTPKNTIDFLILHFIRLLINFYTASVLLLTRLIPPVTIVTV